MKQKNNLSSIEIAITGAIIIIITIFAEIKKTTAQAVGIFINLL
ncbi:MAG: hypothetical protein SNJ70_10395 [Armatimonadota bacterium]